MIDEAASLGIAIDPTGAQTGARAVRQSLDDIIDGSRGAIGSVTEFQRSLDLTRAAASGYVAATQQLQQVSQQLADVTGRLAVAAGQVADRQTAAVTATRAYAAAQTEAAAAAEQQTTALGKLGAALSLVNDLASGQGGLFIGLGRRAGEAGEAVAAGLFDRVISGARQANDALREYARQVDLLGHDSRFAIQGNAWADNPASSEARVIIPALQNIMAGLAQVADVTRQSVQEQATALLQLRQNLTAGQTETAIRGGAALSASRTEFTGIGRDEYTQLLGAALTSQEGLAELLRRDRAVRLTADQQAEAAALWQSGQFGARDTLIQRAVRGAAPNEGRFFGDPSDDLEQRLAAMNREIRQFGDESLVTLQRRVGEAREQFGLLGAAVVGTAGAVRRVFGPHAFSDEQIARRLAEVNADWADRNIIQRLTSGRNPFGDFSTEAVQRALITDVQQRRAAVEADADLYLRPEEFIDARRLRRRLTTDEAQLSQRRDQAAADLAASGLVGENAEAIVNRPDAEVQALRDRYRELRTQARQLTEEETARITATRRWAETASDANAQTQQMTIATRQGVGARQEMTVQLEVERVARERGLDVQRREQDGFRQAFADIERVVRGRQSALQDARIADWEQGIQAQIAQRIRSADAVASGNDQAVEQARRENVVQDVLRSLGLDGGTAKGQRVQQVVGQLQDAVQRDELAQIERQIDQQTGATERLTAAIGRGSGALREAQAQNQAYATAVRLGVAANRDAVSALEDKYRALGDANRRLQEAQELDQARGRQAQTGMTPAEALAEQLGRRGTDPVTAWALVSYEATATAIERFQAALQSGNRELAVQQAQLARSRGQGTALFEALRAGMAGFNDTANTGLSVGERFGLVLTTGLQTMAERAGTVDQALLRVVARLREASTIDLSNAVASAETALRAAQMIQSAAGGSAEQRRNAQVQAQTLPLLERSGLTLDPSGRVVAQPTVSVGPVPGSAAAAPAGGVFSAADREILTRIAIAEAGNQGPEGLAGVIFTVLNRAAAGNYGGRSIESVVAAPGQFEPVSRHGGVAALPEGSPQLRAVVGTVLDQIAQGTLADPTHGATFFLNRQIAAQRGTDFGRGNEAHQTAVIGDHAFYGPGLNGAPTGASGGTQDPAAQGQRLLDTNRQIAGVQTDAQFREQARGLRDAAAAETELARAYESGNAAQIRAAEQQQRITQLVQQFGETYRGTIETMVRGEATVQQVLNVARWAYAMDRQIESTRALARAATEGGEAVRQAAIDQDTLTQAQQLGVDAEGELGQKIRDRVTALRAARDEQTAASRTRDLGLQRQDAEAQAGGIGLTGEAAAGFQARARLQSQLNREIADGARYTKDQVGAWLDEAEAVARVSQRVQDANQYAQQFTTTLTGGLRDIITGTTTWQQGLSNVAARLADIAIQMALIRPLENALGGVFGGIFGSIFGGGKDIAFGAASVVEGAATGLVFHGGGLVGFSATPTRSLPMATFLSAPRLHSGLAPDEYPAILQREEEVLTPQNPRHAYNWQGGGSVVNNITVKVEGPASSGDPAADQKQAERIGKAVRAELISLIDQRMAWQTQPRGLLNR